MTTTADSNGARAEEPPPPGPQRPRRPKGRIATAISTIGEILITLGLVLALFVVYSLWWTNVVADREADKKGDRVRENWTEGGTKAPFDPKNGIGFLHLPALGKDFQVLIVRGTERDILNDGVAGYYTKPKAAMPWTKAGNFSLAAHRDGHGAKFHNLNKLDRGDKIVVETKNKWYIYTVFNTLPETSRYNVGVLAPIPKGSGAKQPGRYITLTTCTPVFTSNYRLIVWCKLTRTENVNRQRSLPAELR